MSITKIVRVKIRPGYRDGVVRLWLLIPPVAVSGSWQRRQVGQDIAPSGFLSSAWSRRPANAAGASVVVRCLLGTAKEVGEDSSKWLLENGQTGADNTEIDLDRRPNAASNKIECLVRHVFE